MKNLRLNPLSLLFAFLISMGTACAPRTPTTVPMDDTGTTGLPEDVRAPTTAEYKDYAGRYRLNEAGLGDATIVVENERLYGQMGNRQRSELVPGTDRDQFNAQGMEGVRIKFNRNDQNQVTGIELMAPQGSVRGEKVE